MDRLKLSELTDFRCVLGGDSEFPDFPLGTQFFYFSSIDFQGNAGGVSNGDIEGALC